MSTQCLLTRTTHQLACPRCLNNPRGVTTAHGRDECPECHGNLRNVDLIALLGMLVARAQAVSPQDTQP